jgi:hypothetical protein
MQSRREYSSRRLLHEQEGNATDMAPPTPARTYMVTEAMIDARTWHRRQAPFFRVEEVAKTFFGMSASWLRLKMTPDADHPETWFVLRGQRMEFRRANTAKADSARIFWLSDIEPMAYSLHDFGQIDGARLARILGIVHAVAALYGLFDDSGSEAGNDPAAGEAVAERGEVA